MFRDLWSGNGVGPILTALEPTRGILHMKQVHSDTKISSKVTVGLSGGMHSTNCL